MDSNSRLNKNMKNLIKTGPTPDTGSEIRPLHLPPSPTKKKIFKKKPPKMRPTNPLWSKGAKKPKKVVRQSSRSKNLAENCSLAMSRTESVLVSATGDVLVCRCKRSSTPYMNAAPAESSEFCCKQDFGSAIGFADYTSSIGVPDFMSTIDAWSHITDKNTKPDPGPSDETSINSGVSRYEWEKPEKLFPSIKKKTVQSPESLKKFESSPTVTEHGLLQSAVKSLDSAGILPMPSFDYTHFHEGNNDMIPQKSRMGKTQPFPTIQEFPFEEKKDEEDNSKAVLQPFFHGVPVFLSSLSQIRITKVSANPLGAHVLMISAEALLLTYGLNNHGQLGIGIKSDIQDGSRGFVTTPTLVTPLLENGGKTINCAAGVNHSLVVVSTEGRRLHRVKKTINSSASDIGVIPLKRMTSDPASFGTRRPDDDDEYMENDSVQHHQVYGFGRNDLMKIGLVSTTLAEEDNEVDDEDILLPHRVALHCTVWPQESSSDSSLPPQGIFDIAAAKEHSAALVRRPTGDIEVYMWGNASLGALGVPLTGEDKIEIKGDVGEKPSANVSNIYNLPTIIESLSYGPQKESKLGFPRSLVLGPYCSFVLMSSGCCMSFGYSAEGMLGQGLEVKHSAEPQEVFLPPENGSEEGKAIVSLSAGACHVICITESGKAYSWGVDRDGRLGLCLEEFHTAPVAKDMVEIEWVPQKVDIKQHASKTFTASPEDSTFCAKVCAGYDSSILIMRSGQVLSFGKRSGRLGKGEVESDVLDPQPLHGGLCLFRQEEQKATVESGTEGQRRNAGLIRAHSNLR